MVHSRKAYLKAEKKAAAAEKVYAAILKKKYGVPKSMSSRMLYNSEAKGVFRAISTAKIYNKVYPAKK